MKLSALIVTEGFSPPISDAAASLTSHRARRDSGRALQQGARPSSPDAQRQHEVPRDTLVPQPTLCGWADPTQASLPARGLPSDASLPVGRTTDRLPFTVISHSLCRRRLGLVCSKACSLCLGWKAACKSVQTVKSESDMQVLGFRCSPHHTEPVQCSKQISRLQPPAWPSAAQPSEAHWTREERI